MFVCCQFLLIVFGYITARMCPVDVLLGIICSISIDAVYHIYAVCSECLFILQNLLLLFLLLFYLLLHVLSCRRSLYSVLEFPPMRPVYCNFMHYFCLSLCATLFVDTCFLFIVIDCMYHASLLKLILCLHSF